MFNKSSLVKEHPFLTTWWFVAFNISGNRRKASIAFAKKLIEILNVYNNKFKSILQ